MHFSNEAIAILAPGLMFGVGAKAWSASSDQSAPIIASRRSGDRKGKKMKVLANATALVVALSLMIGLLLAQRNYQNSWREPIGIQTSASAVANTGTLEPGSGYKVVMK
jgi:hypothetical protein